MARHSSKTLEQAIYNHDKLISKQSPDAFFADQKAPNLQAYKAFRNFLLQTSQMPEGIYLKPGGSKQLPRVGPTRAEIVADLNTNETNLIVEVDPAVVRKTATIPALGFSNKFKTVIMLDSDTIQPGDTFGLTIW